MSLKSKITDLESRTSANPIDPSFHGSLLRDIQKVTETVDTIADLRLLENASTEDFVKIRAHNVTGLDKGYGSGDFKFDTQELFSINNVGGYTGSASVEAFTITPLNGFLNANFSIGEKIAFENGASLEIRKPLIQNDTDHYYENGATTIHGILTGNVSDQEKAYYGDDGGVYIRPTYAGFNGIGVYKRVFGKEVFVTPEDYGAIPNDSYIDGPQNECSTEIQKTLDSTFEVRFNAKAYYISSPLYARFPKDVWCKGTNSRNLSARSFNIFKNNATHIYTDQNIDMVIVQAPNVNWHNGVINTELATTHTKAGFRYDLSYRMQGGRLDWPHIQGNSDTLSSAENNGTRAVVIDAQNASNDFNTVGREGEYGGYAFFMDHFFTAQYVHTIWYRNKTQEGNPATTFANSFDVKFYADGYKYVVKQESKTNVSRFEGIVQERHTLSAAQKDDAASTIYGYGAYYNVWKWDMSDQPQNGLYKRYIATELKSDLVEFGPLAKRQYEGGSNTINKELLQGFTIDEAEINRGSLSTVRNLGKDPNHNTRFINSLAFIPERGGSYSIDAYNASTYDLSANLDTSESLPAASGVVLSWTDGLLSPVERPTTLEWNSSADLTNDFVEIVINGPNLDFDLKNLGISYQANGQGPNKVQVITRSGGVDSSHTIEPIIGDALENERASRVYQFSNEDVTFASDTDRIIIRFIGATSTTGIVNLWEIFGYKLINQYYPYIHTGGGQTVHQSLNIDGLISMNDASIPEPEEGNNVSTLRRRLTKTLSVSEILNSNTSEIVLLSDNFNVPLNAYYKWVSGTTQYDTNTNLQLVLGSFDRLYAEINLSSLDTVVGRRIPIPILDMNSFITGGRLALKTQNGNPLNGNISIKIVVDYMKAE